MNKYGFRFGISHELAESLGMKRHCGIVGIIRRKLAIPCEFQVRACYDAERDQYNVGVFALGTEPPALYGKPLPLIPEAQVVPVARIYTTEVGLRWGRVSEECL